MSSMVIFCVCLTRHVISFACACFTLVLLGPGHAYFVDCVRNIFIVFCFIKGLATGVHGVILSRGYFSICFLGIPFL